MRINRDENLVELIPESENEAQELSALWDAVVDCVKFNKKLVPIGEFTPGKNDRATFHIEE